jgi:hypothetical protein
MHSMKGIKFDIYVLACLTYNNLEGSVRGFDPGQDIYKVVNTKRVSVRETKNCGPLYLSEQKVPHRWRVACSGLNPKIRVPRRVMMGS